VISSLLFVANANAADLYVLPDGRSFTIGVEFSADIKISTDEAHINASQATVHFSNDLLELVSVDKEGSTFNFWVAEPTISNEEGTMSFMGGTAKGVTGEALQVLKMRFKTKGAGTADITLSEAAVTASDGQGTNVLSTIKGTSISIGTQVVPPEPAPEPPAPTETTPPPEQAPKPEQPVEVPERVVRRAVLAKNLPVAVQLRVPLYPDQEKWYNHLSEVMALWEVPNDITKIATALDENPNTKPTESEGELFTGKSFGVLEEGIWYIHVRFRNNKGWSEVAHYKIAIDTTAPLPFEIQMDNQVSDDPRPEIRYEAQDSFSGFSHAVILVDDRNIMESSTTVAMLPIQSLGKHTLLVRVFDKARNSVEDDLEFEILPLLTPTIDFVTETVSQGELVFASGYAVPNAFVDVYVLNKSGQEVFKVVVNSDGLGNWEVILEEPLSTGKYSLSIAVRDERGATSYSSGPRTFKIGAKTVLSIGFVDLGWFEILIIIILFVISGVSITAWRYNSTRKKREAYKIMAGRDVDKLAGLLGKNLKELEGWTQSPESGLNSRARAESEHSLKRMKDTIIKMKKYLGQEISKLK